MRRAVCFKDWKRIEMCLTSMANDFKPATVKNYGSNMVKVIWDNGRTCRADRSAFIMHNIKLPHSHENQKVVVADYYFEAMFTSGRYVNVEHVTEHELLDGGKRIKVRSRTQGEFIFMIDKLDGWCVSYD